MFTFLLFSPVQIGAADEDDDEEAAETSYQIVGTWTAMKEAEEMTKSKDSESTGHPGASLDQFGASIER